MALALLATGSGELLGGPGDAADLRVDRSVHPGWTQAHESRSRFAADAEARPCDPHTVTSHARPLQVGDPIHLRDGFFTTPLAGGVGPKHPTVMYQNRGLVVVHGEAFQPYGASYRYHSYR